MHYPDLTPYEYTRGYEGANLLNVGWLERGHDFSTGECSDAFLVRLFALCQSPIERKRGIHACNLGCRGDARYLARRDGVELRAGNGEMQADSANGTAYRAPTLIYHYVTEHKYLPPQEFIAAVMNTAIP